MSIDEPTIEPGSVTTEERPVARCEVCEHDISDHDAISLRFCHATQTQALSRRCLCRP